MFCPNRMDISFSFRMDNTVKFTFPFPNIFSLGYIVSARNVPNITFADVYVASTSAILLQHVQQSGVSIEG